MSTTLKSSIKPYSFGRHQTFHLRDGWIYKGLEAIKNDGYSLSGTESHHELGVGIAMLEAIRYWLQASNLVEVDKNKTVEVALKMWPAL